MFCSIKLVLPPLLFSLKELVLCGNVKHVLVFGCYLLRSLSGGREEQGGAGSATLALMGLSVAVNQTAYSSIRSLLASGWVPVPWIGKISSKQQCGPGSGWTESNGSFCPRWPPAVTNHRIAMAQRSWLHRNLQIPTFKHHRRCHK